MFQHDNDFDTDRPQDPTNTNKEVESNLDRIDANLSSEGVALRKKQLESILSKLIIFGLALGTVLGIGAYYLLNKFGLTKKPYQIEQEKIEREKSSDVDEIEYLPIPDPFNDRFEI